MMVKVGQDKKTMANKEHEPKVIFTEFAPSDDEAEEEEAPGVSDSLLNPANNAR